VSVDVQRGLDVGVAQNAADGLDIDTCLTFIFDSLSRFAISSPVVSPELIIIIMRAIQRHSEPGVPFIIN
jgi:hypothetical protein